MCDRVVWSEVKRHSPLILATTLLLQRDSWYRSTAPQLLERAPPPQTTTGTTIKTWKATTDSRHYHKHHRHHCHHRSLLRRLSTNSHSTTCTSDWLCSYISSFLRSVSRVIIQFCLLSTVYTVSTAIHAFHTQCIYAGWFT